MKSWQDDDWFRFWIELVLKLRQNYDFENDRWIHLPYAGGFMDQYQQGPYLMTCMEYLIHKEKGLRGGKDAVSGT